MRGVKSTAGWSVLMPAFCQRKCSATSPKRHDRGRTTPPARREASNGAAAREDQHAPRGRRKGQPRTQEPSSIMPPGLARAPSVVAKSNNDAAASRDVADTPVTSAGSRHPSERNNQQEDDEDSRQDFP